MGAMGEGDGKYSSISGIIHPLHGNLVVRQRGQLLRDRRTDDRSHVPELARAAGEYKCQRLAFAVVFDAVFGHSAD